MPDYAKDFFAFFIIGRLFRDICLNMGLCPLCRLLVCATGTDLFDSGKAVAFHILQHHLHMVQPIGGDAVGPNACAGSPAIHPFVSQAFTDFLRASVIAVFSGVGEDSEPSR